MYKKVKILTGIMIAIIFVITSVLPIFVCAQETTAVDPTCKIKSKVNIALQNNEKEDNALIGENFKKGDSYIFDSHMVSFEVKIGKKSYVITREKLFLIASDIGYSGKIYQLMKNVYLRQTVVADTFDLYVSKVKQLRIFVDQKNNAVELTGEKNVLIENVKRVYQFDESITGFTVIAGCNAYPVTMDKVAFIVNDWDNNQSCYKVPGTNIILYRTQMPYVYQVKMDGYPKFSMKVDTFNRSVFLCNGPKLCIRNIIREFSFDKSVTGFTLQIGCASYDVSLGTAADIALAWENNEYCYQVPGTNILLYRTFSNSIYGVEIGNCELFTMTVDRDNRKVILYGGIETNFIHVKNIH